MWRSYRGLRSGYLSIARAEMTTNRAALRLPILTSQRIWMPRGNRYAAMDPPPPRKLPIGHRYAVKRSLRQLIDSILYPPLLHLLSSILDPPSSTPTARFLLHLSDMVFAV